MLYYYLGKYLEKNDDRKKTNIYPNMNDSSKVDMHNFKQISLNAIERFEDLTKKRAIKTAL